MIYITDWVSIGDLVHLLEDASGLTIRVTPIEPSDIVALCADEPDNVLITAQFAAVIKHMEDMLAGIERPRITTNTKFEPEDTIILVRYTGSGKFVYYKVCTDATPQGEEW